MKKHEPRSNTEKIEESMAKENIWILTFKMSMPVIILMLTTSTYIFIDSILASILPGPEYPNGSEVIAVANPLNSILIASVCTISIGASIAYSSALAKRQYERAYRLLSNSLYVNLILAVVLFIFGLIVTIPFERLISGDPTITWNSQEAIYMWFSLINLFPYVMFDFSLRILRSEGHAVKSSIIGLIGIPINILFDVIFMSPNILAMGPGFSALATFIANTVAVTIAFLTILYLKKRKQTNFFHDRESYHFDSQTVRSGFILGFPSTFRRIVTAIGSAMSIVFLRYFIVNGLDSQFAADLGINPFIINHQDRQVLAEQAEEQLRLITVNLAGVFTRTQDMMVVAMLGLVQGSGSILAFNYARKDYERVKELTFVIIIYTIIILFISLLIVESTAEIILRWMGMNDYATMTIFGIPLITNPEAYWNTIVLVYQILFISSIFLAASFVPFWYTSYTKKPISSLWIVTIRGVILYTIFLWPWFAFLGPNHYILASFGFLINEFIFMVYLSIYFYFLIKHIHDRNYQPYETKFLYWIFKRDKKRNAEDYENLYSKVEIKNEETNDNDLTNSNQKK